MNNKENNAFSFTNMDFSYNECSKNEFVKTVSLEVYRELDDQYKDFILKHKETWEHHFGLGLYIRNKYIYGKEMNFLYIHADDLSSEIVERIVEMVLKE